MRIHSLIYRQNVKGYINRDDSYQKGYISYTESTNSKSLSKWYDIVCAGARSLKGSN